MIDNKYMYKTELIVIIDHLKYLYARTAFRFEKDKQNELYLLDFRICYQ